MLRLSRHCPLSQPHWNLRPQALWNIKQQRWLLALVVGCSGVSTAWADPNLPAGYDPALSSGVSSVVNSGTTQTITTNAQDSLGSFNTFNIGAGYSVNVNQPNAGSNFMGVVRSGSPTQIYGSLNSNGTVGIVNPGGVYVGPNGAINTQGFIGTTHQLDQEKYLLEGQLEFNHIPGNTSSVVNDGTITVGENGFVLLSGQTVENNGTITAPGGEVNLVASDKVQLSTLDGVNLRLERSASLNPNDPLFAGIVNNTGKISVSGLYEHSGQVTLLAPNGRINFSGSALAETGAPSSIDLLGDDIHVSGSLIANSETGGGQIRIGGDYQGQLNGDTLNATTTTITETATIQANALESGDGGTLIAWADDITTVGGNFEAKGGPNGGNGGLVETSGKVQLTVEGTTTADTTAARGQTGTWLLDPEDLTIANSGGDITPGTITTALNSNNVVIHTANSGLTENGDITVTDAVSYDSGNSLSLLATRHLFANASIQNSGSGTINLVAGWDESTGYTPSGPAGLETGLFDMNPILASPSSYGNNLGSIYIGNSSLSDHITVGSFSGNTNLAAYDLSLVGSNSSTRYVTLGTRNSNSASNPTGNIGITLQNDLLMDSNMGRLAIGHTGYHSDSNTFHGNYSGDITITANNVTLQAGHAGSNDNYAQIGHGGRFNNGSLSGDITINAAGDINVLAGSDSRNYDYAMIGHGGLVTKGAGFSGDISLSADNLNLVGSTNTTNNYGFATVGHGGIWSEADATGNITVDLTGNLNMTGGSQERSYTQIGHNGIFNGSGVNSTGNISITGQDVIMTGGQNASKDWSYALIGHSRRYDSTSNLTGDITLDVRDLTLQGGPNYQNFAQVGHHGVWTSGGTPGTTSGNLSVTARDVQLLAGAAGEGTAQIGHGGTGDNSNIVGNLTLDANSLYLKGSEGADYAGFSLVGHGGAYAGYLADAYSITGDINVTVANDLTLLGADSPGETYNESYAQLGHSTVYGENVTVSGDLTVTTGGDILLQGSADDLSFAQIGHGGAYGHGTFDGDVTVTASGSITAQAGGGWLSYAQIGHGGAYEDAMTASGNITVQASSLGFSGGAGSEAYAILGHGGFYNDVNLSGDIAVTTTGNLNFTAGSNWATYAQLGHGTIWGSGPIAGNITVQANDVNFVASNSTSTMTAFALLGHGGTEVAGSKTGNISLDATGNVLFQSGADWNNFAQLGHNSYNVASDMTGDISVNTTGNLTFQAMNGSESHVQLGHGGSYIHSNSSITGDIAVQSASTSFEAGTNNKSFAILGHGGEDYEGNIDGHVNVSTGDLSLTAGTAFETFTQLGHGGDWGQGNFSGNITVNADNVLLKSGSGEKAGVSVGHGNSMNTRAGNREGNISLVASGEVSLVDNGARKSVIGHKTTTNNGTSNANVLIQSDSLDFVDDAPSSGSYTIDSATFVSQTETNLTGGDVTLVSTNGPINWNTALNSNSENSLSLLSTDGVTVNQSITNTGTGLVTLVAGWDGNSNAIAADASVNTANLGLQGTDTENLTLNSAVTSNASSGSLGILAMADGEFTASLPSSLNSGSGYYLLFATSRTGTALNGLSATNYYGGLANNAITSKSSTSHIFDYGATLDVSALNQTTVYGEALNNNLDHLNFSGFLDGDSLLNLSGTAAFSSSGQDVGTHSLSITQGALASAEAYKYRFSGFTGATNTVTPRAIVISAADSVKVQGWDNPNFRLTDFSSQLAYSDDMASLLNSSPNFTTSALKDSPVGNYSILTDISAFNGSRAPNYSITLRPGQLRVLSYPQAIREGLMAESVLTNVTKASSILPPEVETPKFQALPTPEQAQPVNITNSATEIKLLAPSYRQPELKVKTYPEYNIVELIAN